MGKRKLVTIISVILFIAYVTTFNYGGAGGCGDAGEIISGSSFTPSQSPSLKTKTATDITPTTAILNGTVNPNGVTTFVYFPYGRTIQYSDATVHQNIGSGTTPVNVSATITGLSANTLYNFKVVATNAEGTPTCGLNQTFDTSTPPAPSSTTHPATNITYNSARLNGTVNPNGGDTNSYFNYGLSPAGEPRPNGGTTSYTVTTSSQNIGGTSTVVVTVNINGLSASTLYNFRVVATNAGGTTNGLNQTFTTSAPPPPSSTTNAANNITTNSSRLAGTVNPNGSSTTAYFQWGLTTSYGSSTTSQNIGTNTSDVNVTTDISGLSLNTLYNFRVVGTSNSGTTYGNNLTFSTTPLPPTCTTNTANNITSNSARLNGTVNTNGGATDVYFEYGISAQATRQTVPVGLVGSGTGNIPVNADISGLSGSTLYNFRVVATNAGGTTNGNNLTFSTTPPPPTCTTDAASNIDATFATLNGTVNPNGVNVTSCIFQYGTSQSYGSQINASPYSFSPKSDVFANISSLSASILYNFRVVATNAGGTTNGLNQTFTTSRLPPPTCTTDPATNIASQSVALNGTVNYNGASTTAYFQWGLSTSYGRGTTSGEISGNGRSNVNVAATANINGLSPNTTYYFQMVATNSAGTTYGTNQTFTTGAPGPSVWDNIVQYGPSVVYILNGVTSSVGQVVQTYGALQWLF